MKQYEFNDKLIDALDTRLIIANVRCRMNSIRKILENREEFNISDYYADIIYNQYLELEKELVTHIREFYNRVYDSLESYDNKIEEMTTPKEEK